MNIQRIYVGPGAEPVLMFRLLKDDGSQVLQADVTTITYTIQRLCETNWVDVEGHVDVSLAVASVIFDTLQTGPPWDANKDPTGYNMRHKVPNSPSVAFAEWESSYMVTYTVTLVDGSRLLPRYWVPTNELR